MAARTLLTMSPKMFGGSTLDPMPAPAKVVRYTGAS